MSAPTHPTPEVPWMRSAELFGRWRHGDAEALEELVRTSSPRLWKLARAYGLEAHTAEDVVQTTWMALVSHRDRIEEPTAVTAWLVTTARREAWRAARTASKVTVCGDDLFDPSRCTDSSEDAVQASLETEHLWRAVRRLPARCRRLLVVVAYEDHPDYRRLADELAMPVGSVGPTRARCLAKLRALLEEQASR